MIKALLLIAGAAVGGIYLTSDEGKEARKVLEKRKSSFKPIIEDLFHQANQVLQGTKELRSSEVRKSIEALINEAKDTLADFDLEKTVDGIREAIVVASKKIRESSNTLESNRAKTLSENKETTDETVVPAPTEIITVKGKRK